MITFPYVNLTFQNLEFDSQFKENPDCKIILKNKIDNSESSCKLLKKTDPFYQFKVPTNPEHFLLKLSFLSPSDSHKMGTLSIPVELFNSCSLPEKFSQWSFRVLNRNL